MRFLLLVTTLFISLLTLQAATYDIIIPEKSVQERINHAFPIVKETMFLTLKVSDPLLHLDGVKQRVNFTAVIKIPNIKDADGKIITAKVDVSSRIAYSPGGNIYLRKIKVVDIESDYLKGDIKNVLHSTIEKALNAYFKSRTIYSLKEDKGLIGAAVKSIKNVVIVEKGIKVIFAL